MLIALQLILYLNRCFQIVIISGLVGIVGWLPTGGLEPAHQLSLQAFRLQAQALQGGLQLGNLSIKGLGHEQCWDHRLAYCWRP